MTKCDMFMDYNTTSGFICKIFQACNPFTPIPICLQLSKSENRIWLVCFHQAF